MNPPVYKKYVNGKGDFWKYIRIYSEDKKYLNIRENLGLEGRRDRVDRFSPHLVSGLGKLTRIGGGVFTIRPIKNKVIKG